MYGLAPLKSLKNEPLQFTDIDSIIRKSILQDEIKRGADAFLKGNDSFMEFLDRTETTHRSTIAPRIIPQKG